MVLRRLDRMVTATNNLVRWKHDPLRFFQETLDLGPVARVPMALAREAVFVVNDPDRVTEVLNTPDVFSKDTRGQELLRVVLGVGLLTSEGTTWKRRRRLAQPAFRRPKLGLYAEQMARVTEERLSRLPDRVDIRSATMLLTLDIATVTLFGDRFDAEGEVVSEAMEQLMASYMRLLPNPLPHPERLPIPAARSYQHAIEALNTVVDGLVRRRRQQRTDGDDLLHLWLASDLPDEAVRDEVITMLLAAHETTANALAFTLALLSWHPDVRRRLQAAPDDDDLLDAVIKESLRLYPPAWITARAATTDTVLGGEAVPAGSLLVVPIRSLQRDPRGWKNPQGFDPDRWADGPTGVWMPFGAGQRKCIGSHFAMLELRIVLRQMLNAVELDLEPAVQLTLDPAVTLRPAEPLWASVVRR